MPRGQFSTMGWVGFVGLGLALLVAGAVAVDRVWPPDLRRVNAVSPQVLAADGQLLRAFTSADGFWRLPVTLDQVSPTYLQFLVAYEDRHFYEHGGVNWLALVRATAQAAYFRRPVSGGSTLTMQTARLLEPQPRSWRRKLYEIARAVQLSSPWSQHYWDKSQVLTAYLALAPFGGNLEGVRAASLAYLGKEPRHLTPAEAALLVVIPQSPNRFRPDRHPERAKQARDKVLQRMATLGVLDDQAVTEAMNDPVPTLRRDMPFWAAHLAQQLRRSRPTNEVIHATTVDFELQQTVERLLVQANLPAPTNAAALVVEHALDQGPPTVRAYVGSAHFFDARRQGQVDLVRAVRSPGSTLKPLVYGMAFDEGLLHPNTLMRDQPMRFGDYAPTNFHGEFHGQVTAATALQQSLNVPAVQLLAQVGPLRLNGRLRDAQIRLHTPHDLPAGLPLILGGVGITLWDLVTVYTALARDGDVQPLVVQPSAMVPPPAVAPRLMSPAAAHTVAAILADAPLPPGVAVNAHRRAIAFKTGTSYGYRDAWALGFDGRFTVGVWVGRADGSPSPGQFGRITAAPWLWRIFENLPPTPLRVMAATALTESPTARLQRFAPIGSATRPRRDTGQPLQLRFPVHQSRVEWPKNTAGERLPLPLRTQGGRRPLRFFVNDQPLPMHPTQRQAWWTPDGLGAVAVTVIDADGQQDTSRFWLVDRLK